VVDWSTVPARPLVPDYAGACLTNLVPAILGPAGTAGLPDWFPEPAHGARQVVLFVLDGLGWEQLLERSALAPTLATMAGRPIDAVAPTTTATSLTSIATGLTPGEHGVVGYRMAMHGEVLNVLRWSTPAGDARRRIVPDEVQPRRPFLGSSVPVVAKTEFVGSGFTLAHLAGVRHVGWRLPSSLAVEVGALLREGERFVYAYYDGIDKVAHEYGLGRHYDAELQATDRLVADMAAVLPPGAVLLVTADHGQVDVPVTLPLAPEVVGFTRLLSGEGRFRWLHAAPGREAELLDAATTAHSGQGWVVPLEQVLDEGWLGPRVTSVARSRLGDVAVVARDPVSFDDPADTGAIVLRCRHGSLTAAEVRVPLLAAGGA
jgi:predicted AlkP superfamily pyrophosphatase or phosphodiesterase